MRIAVHPIVAVEGVIYAYHLDGNPGPDVRVTSFHDTRRKMKSISFVANGQLLRPRIIESPRGDWRQLLVEKSD
jgi:hypothetical protein